MTNKKYKKILYKQKRFLLFYLSALSIVAHATSNPNSKEYDGKALNIKEEALKNLNNKITKEVSEVLKVKNNSVTSLDRPLAAGISVEILKSLGEEVVKKIESEEEKKIYYDFDCSNEMQDYIFQISKKYNVPFEIIMTIIERESGGRWHTNGIISSTNDYGLTQINKCNLKYIQENLGYSSEEILYEPYKAIEAQAFLLKEIIDLYGYTDEINYQNVFGTYNGWTKWYELQGACEYANACMEILKEKFDEVSRMKKI